MKSNRLFRFFAVAVPVLVLLALILPHAYAGVEPARLEAVYGGSSARFTATPTHGRLHYRDEGPTGGQPILLLHGTASSLHTFDDVAAGLRERHRVLRFDLPGFGLSGPCKDCSYSPAEDARVVAEFLAAVGEERAVIVAGNSLGGRIAWEFALQRPESVRGLVLIDSLGYPWPEKPAGIALARVPLLGAVQQWITPRFLIRQSLLEVYGDDTKVDAALVERHHQLLLRRGNRRAFVARVNHELDAEAPRIRRLDALGVPVLVLWGEADAWIPVAHASHFAEDLPGATVITYPGIGHVPQEEAPRRVTSDVQKFVSRL